MGTFTHSITLLSASGEDTETVEALVDTGSTFTIVPAPILERLRVVPERTVALRLANGQLEHRSIAEVRAALDGVGHTILCVFGEPGSPAVIGAHTLEGFLLGVDPVEGRLVPIEGYW